MPTMIMNNYLWIIDIFVIPKEQNGTLACVLMILVGPIQFIPGFTHGVCHLQMQCAMPSLPQQVFKKIPLVVSSAGLFSIFLAGS